MNALDPIRARLDLATPGPWFLNDCEGQVIILPEEDLIGVTRDSSGHITSWGLPTSWPPERRILEIELDTWDEGEDIQDDQVRANAEFVANAPTDVERLLYAVDSVLAYGLDRKMYTDTGDSKVDAAIRSYAYHVERLIGEALGGSS